jgi:molybdenum cofactor cytidylyltransferase
MGTQKLLLPYGGGTVISQVVDQAAAARVDDIVVVVGEAHDAIAEALRKRPVRLVTNRDPGSEMLTSVRVGLRALSAECRAALVVLGDQPGVTTALIDRLVAAHDASAQGVVVPVCGGRRGHPILIADRHFAALLQQYDGVGLRGLLADHPEDVLEVPVESDAALRDMDTPDDYQRAVGT